MEKVILEILRNIDNRLSDIEENQNGMKSEINGMKNEIIGMKSDISSINKKLDGVVEETANLLEFRSEVITKIDSLRDDLSAVELVTANNYRDIAKLKAIK